MIYLLAFSMVYAIVFMIIPYLAKLAIKIDFVDKPTERKKHKKPVPLLGGLGIYIGVMAGYSIFVRPVDKQFTAIIISSFMILAIGMIDDWYKTRIKEFPILPRALVHILSAIIVFKSGIVFRGVSNPVNGQYIILPYWIQFSLTILWIFGVTTVINWSDGLDGLAASLVAISGSTLLVVAMAKGQTDSVMMAALLVGGTLGFLKYNRNPALIFMGDSGANFLGFLLAVIALEGAFKSTTLISVFIPIISLGIPIFDNIFVIFKRFKEGKPIFKADRSQLHFRLQSYGMDSKQVVTFISLISVCLSLVSIIILFLKV